MAESIGHGYLLPLGRRRISASDVAHDHNSRQGVYQMTNDCLNRRAVLLLAMGIVSASSPLSLTAQPAKPFFRIGVLETLSRELNGPNFTALQHGLRNLGYVEGQNLVIDYLSADGRTARFPEMADQLVRRNVDVIVTRGTPAAIAAQKATTTIPIVMAAIGEPLALVGRLGHPAANLTGLSAFG